MFEEISALLALYLFETQNLPFLYNYIVHWLAEIALRISYRAMDAAAHL